MENNFNERGLMKLKKIAKKSLLSLVTISTFACATNQNTANIETFENTNNRTITQQIDPTNMQEYNVAWMTCLGTRTGVTTPPTYEGYNPNDQNFQVLKFYSRKSAKNIKNQQPNKYGHTLMIGEDYFEKLEDAQKALKFNNEKQDDIYFNYTRPMMTDGKNVTADTDVFGDFKLQIVSAEGGEDSHAVRTDRLVGTAGNFNNTTYGYHKLNCTAKTISGAPIKIIDATNECRRIAGEMALATTRKMLPNEKCTAVARADYSKEYKYNTFFHVFVRCSNQKGYSYTTKAIKNTPSENMCELEPVTYSGKPRNIKDFPKK